MSINVWTIAFDNVNVNKNKLREREIEHDR